MKHEENEIVTKCKEVLDKSDRIGNTVETAGKQLPGKDSELIIDISKKIEKIKLNRLLKKKLAKRLSIEEKQALKWESISEAFACVDTCKMAIEHPKDAAGIVRTIADIVSVILPFAIPIAIKLSKMPDEEVAKIAMYCGALTPEHILSQITETKYKSAIITEEEAMELYKAKKLETDKVA